MTELRVCLAEAPTDVLVYLVDNGPTETLELLHAVAPDDSSESKLTLSRAMGLLVEIGYVHEVPRSPWTATVAGVAAVVDARSKVTVTTAARRGTDEEGAA